MTQNLFAACRVADGSLVTKRVRLDASVQAAVQNVFTQQAYAFKSGVRNELPFDGGYEPDEDEILTLDVLPEAQIFIDTIDANAISFPEINTDNFAKEGIKALFTGTSYKGSTTVLIQRFGSQQSLEKRFALLQHGNAFRKLTEAAFTLDNTLTCIIEDNKIKFKSQQKLRGIINLLEAYRTATEQEVFAFASHPKISVGDPQIFADTTNQITRRLIHAIASAKTLENASLTQIQEAAKQTGLNIHMQNGRIVMPTDHADIKALLQFLNESRYSGPLTGTAYVTNSRRRV